MREGKVQFEALQSLRGLAAAWVVLFHIYKGNYVEGLVRVLPGVVTQAVFGYGSAGVAVFFVLSGFVIAHSLSGQAMDGGGFLRFVARRSVRLDPPYWMAIALSAATAALLAMAHHQAPALPSAGTVAAHVFYAQELLRLPAINLVFWTLTYEVQFYLVLALAAWARTVLVARGLAAATADRALLIPTATLALAAAWLGPQWALPGLFANLWHGFFLGVLAYRAGWQRQSPALLFLLAGVTLAGAVREPGVFGMPCAATALFLFGATRTGYLRQGLAARPLRFLGTISYSLYLVHVPLIALFFGAWGRLAGRGVAGDALGFVVNGAAVVAAAWLFWRLFEWPTHALAARLFQRRGAPIPA